MSGRAGPSRRPWVAWSVVVIATALFVGVLGSLVLRGPSPLWVGAATAMITVPVAAVGSSRRFVRFGRSVLVATVSLGAVVLMVCVLFAGVALAVGRRPSGDERTLFVVALVASLAACAAVSSVHRRVGSWARAIFEIEPTRPDRILTTLTARMTRAVPMDELLLQVVETLRRTLTLSSAEIWTGEDGRLDRVVSLPELGPATTHLAAETTDVVTRAGAQGNAWLEMWMPDLMVGRASIVRSVSIRHGGELLGLLILERSPDGDPFTTDEDAALVELARSLGLALHNVRLDSALRASVTELERRNVELRESRARIVAVADDARREIERNLHDGAQQHLVTLAVQIGLIRSTLESQSGVTPEQLQQLAVGVDMAIEELRELAHGIYPPRLRDRGLSDALQVAAARSAHPVTVDATGIERYAPEVEAAVYFCCLEAIQNAEKHAGDCAGTRIRLVMTDDRLEFDISDDGAGFDPAAVVAGQGIVNMHDRVGAIDGEVAVHSEPGCGTTVSGSVRARPIRADRPTDAAHRATRRD